jgi:glycosyltransferase involved in cell wall biosynthesis
MSDPAVSVVIPTRDRPRQLEACLRSLSRLEHPQFEVVVADDGATPLSGVVESAGCRLEVTVLRTGGRGPAAARNAALERASGDVIAFTDDDCIPRPDWLSALTRRLLEQPDALVGGATVNGRVESACSAASQLIVDLAHAHFNADPSAPRFFATNNVAAHAETLRRVGRFDIRFRCSEDRELCDRWLHTGRPLVLAPDAVVEHHHELSLPAFARQHFGYGRGAYLFERERRRRGSGSLTGDLGFHARLPGRVRAAVAGKGPRERIALLSLLALWQVSYAAGFAHEAARQLIRAEPPPPRPVATGARPIRARRRRGSAPARRARRP